MLKCLQTEGPLRAGALADCLQSDPSTVSRQVAALVKDGLLERRADPDDGRASLLVLTDAATRRAGRRTTVAACSTSPTMLDGLERRRPAALRRAARPLHRRLRHRQHPRDERAGAP